MMRYFGSGHRRSRLNDDGRAERLTTTGEWVYVKGLAAALEFGGDWSPLGEGDAVLEHWIPDERDSFEVKVGVTYCRRCGRPLVTECSVCGKPLRRVWRNNVYHWFDDNDEGWCGDPSNQKAHQPRLGDSDMRRTDTMDDMNDDTRSLYEQRPASPIRCQHVDYGERCVEPAEFMVHNERGDHRHDCCARHLAPWVRAMTNRVGHAVVQVIRDE